MRFVRPILVLLACVGVIVTLVVDQPTASAVAPAPRSPAAHTGLTWLTGLDRLAGLTGEDPPPPDACGARIPKKTGGYWECSFDDEFDGTSLDPTKWLAQQTSVSGVTNGGGGCYRDEPWTISVKGGMLRLTARQLLRPFLCRSPFGSFRTDRAAATVSTRGRFSQAYGRFEVRVKMPDVEVPGAHSAFWLFPHQSRYGAWPFSGEIDVAEWYSAIPRQIYPSLHYVDGLKDIHTGLDGAVRNASAFHAYGLEWTPERMFFSYDGKVVYEHAWSPLAPLLGSQPFDQPFNLILTQAWGGLWNAPTADTPTRVRMTVDWVRAWR